jgi:hypothetical protein
LLEALEVRAKELQQLSVRAIAVRHVSLIREKDEIRRGHALTHSREHREAAQSGVEQSDHCAA